MMGDSFVKANDAWWAEKKDYNITDISSYKFEYVTGHFTQMAWPSSIEVGCGYALYKDDKFDGNEIVVCNYAYAGNMLGNPMYKVGDKCSECDEGSTCSTEFPGLCGATGLYRDKITSTEPPKKEPISIKIQSLTDPSVLINKVSILNSVGEPTLTVKSGLDGHALLILTGNNFKNLKNYDLICYFQPIDPASDLKNYSSKILKDKTTCSSTDYECIYWNTSYQFTDTQIGCYTPPIPKSDHAGFAKSVDYYVTIVYRETSKVTCKNMSDCKVNIGLANTAVISYINANNIQSGYKLSFVIDQKVNSHDSIVDIKVILIYFHI